MILIYQIIIYNNPFTKTHIQPQNPLQLSPNQNPKTITLNPLQQNHKSYLTKTRNRSLSRPQSPTPRINLCGSHHKTHSKRVQVKSTKKPDLSLIQHLKVSKHTNKAPNQIQNSEYDLKYSQIPIFPISISNQNKNLQYKKTCHKDQNQYSVPRHKSLCGVYRKNSTKLST